MNVFGNNFDSFVSNTLMKIHYLFFSKTPLLAVNAFFISVGTFVLTFVQQNWYLYFSVLLAILYDTFWGLCVSFSKKNTKIFPTSRKAVSIVYKFIAYFGTLFLVNFIEHFNSFDSFICSKFLTTVLILIEIWSAMGNMLIVNPNFPFPKLIKKYIVDEIANKIGIGKEEVASILENKDCKDFSKECIESIVDNRKCKKCSENKNNEES